MQKSMNNYFNLINLTPYKIKVMGEGPTQLHREKKDIYPIGEVARVIQTKEIAGVLQDVRSQGVCPLFYVKKEGVVIEIKERISFGNYKKETIATEAFPEPVLNTLFIVSAQVAAELPERGDLIAPTELVRNEDGHIIGCKAFIKNEWGAEIPPFWQAPQTTGGSAGSWGSAEDNRSGVDS